MSVFTRLPLLIVLMTMTFCFSVNAQTAWEIQKKVDDEVNALMAELEPNKNTPTSVNNTKPALQKNDNASALSVYKRNSKQKIADLSVVPAYTVIKDDGAWLIVRFKQASISGWVSKDYVNISQGKVIVDASILNLRAKPTTSSTIIERLPKGYSSVMQAEMNGFVKILASANLVVALKKTQLGLPIRTAKPSTQSEPTIVSNSRESNATIANNESKAITDSGSSRSLNQNQRLGDSNNTASERERSHKIAPGDAISLLVFGEPDLSQENVRVSQTGQVSFPLIGAVSVAGKTTDEVEQIVLKILADGYVRNPRLSVSIFSYRPFFIRGAVAETGSYPYTIGLTVSKAIALAGGSKNSANKNGVSIMRDGEVVLENISIDSQVVISSGDVITIDEEFGGSDDVSTYIYLHGEVASPGEYLFRKGLTVEKAVVLAGGFTLRASKKRVSITRYLNKSEGEEPDKLKKVRLYTPVQPGDVIDVGASWF